MNKAELLVEMGKKFESVLGVAKQDESGNVAWYVANVLDRIADDVVTRRNIGFYVVDDEEPGEVAYWDKSEPKGPATPDADPFAEKLTTELGKHDFAEVVKVDVINKSAVIEVTVVDGLGYKKELKLVKLAGENVEVKDLTDLVR